ncbi:methyltransferase domain-containing protein [Halobacillus mangrovi]|uniref:Methyltransferase domain-containing protein n=1 Tax=Halobacillus mangrovi TaxID=402384 RepID=A0A1W5ZSE8_9BACI|nr:methyltransferase domain-containing protein [Halobacillus mangrovi]ARI76240.1 hypothetical protein HM131_05050 [Halobacillus mangrovi]
MIKTPLDRVTEAYEGNMGEDFRRKTRSRVNWIVNQVKGTKVLDIGCSQGIIPIILGREGKTIDALDIIKESIDYAKEQLKNEHTSVQENINFRVSNFMTETELEGQYETVLMTEVLEHISDPEGFLKKVHDHLAPEGRLVVTVPFGINDYFDHKRTYFLTNLDEHLSEYFTVENFEFLGGWTGVVCTKKSTSKRRGDKAYSVQNVKKLESSFYEVQRQLLNKVEDLQATLKTKNDYIKRLENQRKEKDENRSRELEQKNKEIETLNERLMDFAGELKKKDKFIREQQKSNNDLLSQLQDLDKTIESANKKVESHFIAESRKLEKESSQKDKEIAELKHQLKVYQFKEEKHQVSHISKDQRIAKLEESIALKNDQIEELKESLSSRDDHIEELKVSLDTRDHQIEALKDELLEEITQTSTETETDDREEAVNIDPLLKQIQRLKSDLSNSLDNEESALQQLIKEIDERTANEHRVESAERKLANVERKYLALKNSKLGKLTLKYWKFRNRRKA